MRFVAALEGRLTDHMRAEADAVTRGSRDAVAAQTRETQLGVRGIIDAALPPKPGSRRRVGNAIRSKLYSDGPGDDTGIVYSKFGRREGGRFVDYLTPHIQGATIRKKGGGYLLLPIKGVSRRLDKARRDLSQLGIDPKLALIPLPGGRLLFVRRSSRNRTVLIAHLVRQVQIDAKINIAPIRAAIPNALARKLVTNLGKADA